MILSKCVYVSSSQRLRSSLDIFFLLGILLRNLVLAALEVVSLVSSFSLLLFFLLFSFADLRMSLGLLEYFYLYRQFI